MEYRMASFRKLEDCLDGSMIFECCFNRTVTRDFILQYKTLGELEYFPDFPRPFYRVTGGDDFQIKGVEGEYSARVILFNENPELFTARMQAFTSQL